MIRYTNSVVDITIDHLRSGFFADWEVALSAEKLLALLQGSDYVVLALDGVPKRVIGFVTAVSDGVTCAFIPLLEVLPTYQGQGIGTELMQRMLDRLRDLSLVALLCTPTLQPFYARLGMRPAVGMAKRHVG
ncbi:MAG: GNAT family N-acetyltransferase [Thermomicrobiales bacterium]